MNGKPEARLYHLPRRLVDVYRSVCIQLSDARCRDGIARFADIFGMQEELGGEVGNGSGCRVVESQALDASKSDVLGDLNAEPLQTHDENVGGTHTLHGLVAQNVELPTVQ